MGDFLNAKEFEVKSNQKMIWEITSDSQQIKLNDKLIPELKKDIRLEFKANLTNEKELDRIFGNLREKFPLKEIHFEA